MGLPSDAPPPRLCHVIKRPDFPGYGFNLHAERTRPGQFIGKVDEGSPAEAAGLREGDRIVEVNGVNISQENHKQVVQRIKAIPNETKLLVIDKIGEEMYKKAGVVIRSSMANVTVAQCSEDINGNNEAKDFPEKSNREVEQESSEKTNSISSTENNKVRKFPNKHLSKNSLITLAIVMENNAYALVSSPVTNTGIFKTSRKNRSKLSLFFQRSKHLFWPEKKREMRSHLLFEVR